MNIYIYLCSIYKSILEGNFWPFSRFLASVVYNAVDGQVQEVIRMTTKQVGSITLFHQTDP